jgi:hypothetical protein
MNKKFSISKKEVKNIFSIFIFASSLLWIFTNLNLHYLSVYAPDFQYYKDYLDYFFQVTNDTNREQGLLYFYFVSFILSLNTDIVTNGYFNQVVSDSIQITNLILYLFGLSGLYQLLKFKKFESFEILITFTILNFFPQTINLIATMKPEILAFSLLTWTFYLIEQFLESDNLKYLYLSSFSVVLLASSKGTILGMVGLCFIGLLVINRSKFKNIKIIKLILFFLLLAIPIFLENYFANQMFLSSHLVQDPKMQEVADISLLYNINFKDLYMYPFRHFHADSLFGMIILDTFGDYFMWYANNDESAFHYIKKENFQNIWIISHWREFFSSLLTVIFYSSVVYLYIKKKDLKFYFLLPAYGLLILLLQAYGFPQKNFNKATAELFKTHYYSFLLLITFAFIASIIIKKSKTVGFIILLIVSFNTSFLYGIPAQKSDEYTSYITEKNKVVSTCNLNSIFISDFPADGCENKEIFFCYENNPIDELKPKYNNSQLFESDTRIYYTFIDDYGNILEANSLEECNRYLTQEFKVNSTYTQLSRLPFFNVLYFIIFIVGIVYNKSKIIKL